MCDLREFDCGARRLACWTFEFGFFARICIGNERVDRLCVRALVEFQRNRAFRLDAERSRAPRCYNKSRFRRCAELLKTMQARLVEPIDRQREKELCTL